MTKRSIPFILSFAVIFGFSLQIGESSWIFQGSRSFLWLPLFLVLKYEINNSLITKNTRLFLFSAIPAFIISFCYVLGYVIDKKGTVLWLLKDSQTAGFGFTHFLSWFLLSCLVIMKLYNISSGKTVSDFGTIFPGNFLTLWLLILAAWLPWILNQFPAIMTADSTDQIEMALGIEPMTDHHPVFHTLLIKTALKTGEQIFGKGTSYQAGIIIYSVIQILIMTAVFASTMRFVIYTKTSKAIKVGALLFFLLYPVHPLYSITVWKDVPFSVSLLFLIMLLADMLINKRQNTYVLIVVAALLLSLFRHNGIYLLLLSLPFIPAAFKTRWKSIFIAFLSAILLYFAWKLMVLPSMNIQSGEASEALSVPLQQIALTTKRQHSTMDKPLLSDIENYFSEPNIWERYDKRISDPVKNVFSEDLYKKDPQTFWKLWGKLGTKYPQDYLDALLIHTYGYWYPEMEHQVFVTGIDDNGLFGVYMDPKLNNQWSRSIVQWLCEAKYDRIPLVSLLFSPGACFWVYIISFFYCLYRKHSAYFLFIPLFFLWLTAIASPVNCEYRYVYGLFLCFPVIIATYSEQKTICRDVH